MKKALKELIENAGVKRTGKFTELMFISNGKYDGFFGPNGFNKMIVLGKNIEESETWYKIVPEGCECDKFDIYSNGTITRAPGFNLDIPQEYGVPRIWFTNYYFKIDYSLELSSLVAELEEK